MAISPGGTGTKLPSKRPRSPAPMGGWPRRLAMSIPELMLEPRRLFESMRSDKPVDYVTGKEAPTRRQVSHRNWRTSLRIAHAGASSQQSRKGACSGATTPWPWCHNTRARTEHRVLSLWLSLRWCRVCVCVCVNNSSGAWTNGASCTCVTQSRSRGVHSRFIFFLSDLLSDLLSLASSPLFLRWGPRGREKYAPGG